GGVYRSEARPSCRGVRARCVVSGAYRTLQAAEAVSNRGHAAPKRLRQGSEERAVRAAPRKPRSGAAAMSAEARMLQDRVVIVVGAGSSGPGWGNGKACAVSFSRAGARVIAVDVSRAA